jgi:hypothetical protein
MAIGGEASYSPGQRAAPTPDCRTFPPEQARRAPQPAEIDSPESDPAEEEAAREARRKLREEQRERRRRFLELQREKEEAEARLRAAPPQPPGEAEQPYLVGHCRSPACKHDSKAIMSNEAYVELRCTAVPPCVAAYHKQCKKALSSALNEARAVRCPTPDCSGLIAESRIFVGGLVSRHVHKEALPEQRGAGAAELEAARPAKARSSGREAGRAPEQKERPKGRRMPPVPPAASGKRMASAEPGGAARRLKEPAPASSRASSPAPAAADGELSDVGEFEVIHAPEGQEKERVPRDTEAQRRRRAKKKAKLQEKLRLQVLLKMEIGAPPSTGRPSATLPASGEDGRQQSRAAKREKPKEAKRLAAAAARSPDAPERAGRTWEQQANHVGQPRPPTFETSIHVAGQAPRSAASQVSGRATSCTASQTVRCAANCAPSQVAGCAPSQVACNGAPHRTAYRSPAYLIARASAAHEAAYQNGLYQGVDWADPYNFSLGQLGQAYRPPLETSSAAQSGEPCSLFALSNAWFVSRGMDS